MVAIVSGESLGLTNSSRNILGGAGQSGSPATGAGGEQVFVNSATGNLIIQGIDESLTGLGIRAPIFRTYNSQGVLDDDNGDNWRLSVQQKLAALTGTINSAGSTITKTFGDGAALVYSYNSTLSRYVSTDGDGAHDSLTFNAGTNQWTWTDGSSGATEIYDGNGHLIESSDRDGNKLTYFYAGNLLERITDSSLGTPQDTFFDYSGNELSAIRVVSLGVTQTLTRYTYDAQGRLSQVRVDLSPASAGDTDGDVFFTTYAYDGTSRRVSSISQGKGTTVGSTVNFTYELINGLHRLKTYSDGAGGVTTLTYSQPAGGGGSSNTVNANGGALSTDLNTSALSTISSATTTHNLNSGVLNTGSGNVWSGATALTGAVTDPQVAFDVNGNGFALFIENGDVGVRRYNRAADVWSSATAFLDIGTGAASIPALAVDAQGNAVAAWVQSDGTASSVYTSTFDATTGTWSAARLLESSSQTVNTATGSLAVARSGGFAAVAWLQNDGTRDNVYAAALRSGVWSGPDLLETRTNNATNLTVSIDGGGTILALWQQSDATSESVYYNRWDPGSPGAWSGATLLETNSAAASSPRAVRNAANVMVLTWVQNGDIYYRRYSPASGLSAATVIDANANPAYWPSVSIDEAGNALLAWVQSDGVANSVYATQFTFATATWSTPTVLESSADVVPNGAMTLSTSINGGHAVVSWLQNDGTRDNLYAARFTGGNWVSPTLLETANTAAGRPTAAIDPLGNVAVLWSQSDGSTNTLYQQRYYAATPAPYYLVQSGDTWASIAGTLYGTSTSQAAETLRGVMGDIALTPGARLLNPPATLTVPVGNSPWGGAGALGTNASTPQVAFDGNGNGFALFIENGDVGVRRYNRANDTWSSATLLDIGTGAASAPALSLDALGNAVAAWVQSNSTGPSVYVSTYDATSGTWSAAAVLENSSESVNAAAGSIAVTRYAGYAAVVWLQNDGTRDNLYAAALRNGAWTAPDLLETRTNNVTNPTVGVDDEGTILILWQQSDNFSESIYFNRWDPGSPGVWSGATLLESISPAANSPRVARNAASHAMMTWAQGGHLYYRRYSPSSGLGAPTVLDEYSNPVFAPSMAMDEAGNALLAWVESDGLATSVYASRFNVATLTWSTPTVLENILPPVPTGVGSVVASINGNYAAVAWVQTDGIRNNLYAARFNGTSWDAPRLLESNTSDASKPVLATDALGNVTVLWQQSDGTANAVYHQRYYATGTSPFYLVQPADTWASIAGTLYGQSSVEAGNALRTALGNPSLIAGMHLTNLPARLTITVTQGVTAQARYVVQPSDTWASITQVVFGVSDMNAAAALQAAAGNPTLTSGLVINVPLALTYTSNSAAGALYLQVDVTNALGQISTFVHDSDGQLERVLTPAVDGTRLETRFAYDSAGNVTTVTEDPAGANRITRHEYDGNGNVLLSRDAAGNTVSRTYSATNQLLTETIYAVADPDGAGSGLPSAPLTSRYVYAENDRLRFIVTAEGRVTEHRYDEQGKRRVTLVYAGERYDVSALGVTTALTEGALETWASAQDLTRLERTDYDYDFRGNLETRTVYTATDGGGEGLAEGASVTRYVYDQRGLLISTIDPRGESTSDPNDYVTTYTYDGLGRLLLSVRWTPDGNVTKLTNTYNDGTRTETTTLANGLTTTTVFDGAGRVLTETLSNGLGATTYAYDANGRLRMVTDPIGVKTHHLYDAAGRRIFTVDGDGSLTEFIYDRFSQVIKTVEYAVAADLSLVQDGSGNPVVNVNVAQLRTSAAGEPAQNRISRVVYDPAHRVAYTIDANGAVRKNLYDGASRLTVQIAYATRLIINAAVDELTLTAGGDINGVTLSTVSDDRVSRSFYDNDGLLIGTLDGAGYLVEHTYDAAGRLIQTTAYIDETDPSWRAAGTFSQLRGSVTPDAEKDISSYFFYDAQGRTIGALDAEGYFTETIYIAGHIRDVKRYDRQLTYTAGTTTFQSLRNQASAPPVTVHTTSYQYDVDGRVTYETNYEGTVTRYSYNPVGYLVGTTRAHGDAIDARTIQRRYDLLGRVTQELTAEGSERILAGDPVEAVWTQYAVTHAYDVAGRRVSTADQHGNTTLFYYDADGRERYSVNASGEITESRYNALGQLTELIRYHGRINPGDLAVGDSLDSAASAVETIRNDNKDNHTHYTYTLTGRVRSTFTAEGTSLTFDYNAFGEEESRIQVIDATRSLERLSTYDRRGLLDTVRWDPSGLNLEESHEYDAFGRLAVAIDKSGNVRRLGYDRLGRVIESYDPSSPSTNPALTTYDAFGRVLTTRDRLGNETTYEYENSVRSVVVTTPEGVSFTSIHNRHGQLVRVTDPNGNITVTEYDRNGNATRITDGLTSANNGVVEERDYDDAGRLVSITDSRGVITLIEYDAANRVFRRTVDAGPGGLARVTQYTYDGTGRTFEVTDENGVVTRTEYDRDGRLLQVTVDPGSAPSLNLVTRYAYDDANNVVRVTEGHDSPKPRVVEYGYDALGRRVSEVVDPGTGINPAYGVPYLNLETTYQYDGNGNVVVKKDAANHYTRYIYDAEDRLRYTVDALNGVTEKRYDAVGNLTHTIRYATATTANAITADPSLPLTLADIAAPGVLIASSSDRAKQTVYDGDGRAVFELDAARGLTRRTFDSNGNVTHTVAFALPVPANVASDYTSLLTWAGAHANDAQNRYTRTVYDLRDRPTYTLDASNAVVRSQYDASGNLIAQTAYAKQLDAAADAALLANLTDAGLRAWTDNAANQRAADRTTRFYYDGAGRTIFQIDGEGYISETRYDDAQHTTTAISYYARPTTLGSAPTLQDVRDAVALPGFANPAADRTETRKYDAAGRLERVTDAHGNFESYEYDAAGNKTEFINKKGARWEYEYDANSRLIIERSPAVEVTSITGTPTSLTASTGPAAPIVTRFKYDTLGNLTERHEAFGTASVRVTQYTYDELGRQVRIDFPAVPTYDASLDSVTTTPIFSEVAYDALGNAVRNRDVGGGYTFKFYDRLGRVQYEVDAENYLTERVYDTFGNETSLIRYAQRLSSPLPQAGTITESMIVTRREPSQDDRELKKTYDRLNRLQSVAQPAVFTFVPSTGGAGGRTIMASPTTFFAYDAFGQVIRESRLVDTLDHPVANPNDSATAAQNAWVHDYFYYDREGHKTATIDAAGYLTTYKYDAIGNVTDEVQYAKALTGWSTTSYSAPTITTRATAPDSAIGYDRETRYSYDRLNRRSSETRYNVEYNSISGATASTLVGDFTTTFGYDVLGNQTRITEASGASTYTHYDALGRVRAIVQPSRNIDGTTAQGSTVTPLVEMLRDAFGNLVQEIRYVNSATNVSESGYTAGARTSDDRVTTLLLDLHGRAIQTQDATGAQRFASYNMRGEIAKEWQPVRDADNNLQTLVTVHEYDLLGRETATVEPQRLGANELIVRKEASYNAFGEIDKKGTNGGWQEKFDYDAAGRMWRTNGENGVYKIFLYDLAGNATAEIRSQTRDLAGETVTASEAAAWTTQRMRTETVYDALGRVVTQRTPTFTTLSGPEAIDSTLSIGNIAGPANPAAIYQRVTINGLQSYVVNPDATLAEGGGYYLDANGNYVQDPNHSLANAVRIVWQPPTDAGVEMLFQYRPAGSTGSYLNLPVATVSGNRQGVNVHGLTNVNYEYKLTYRRLGESTHYAQTSGVFRVDGGVNTTFSITQTTDPGTVIAPLPSSFSNGLVTWTAPSDTSVTATFRVKLSGSSTWTDFAATRTGNSFQASLLSALPQQGTYDYQVVYRRNGVIVGQNDGQLSSTGSGMVRTATGTIEPDAPLSYQVPSVAALSGTSSGNIGAVIVEQESYNPGPMPPPYPAPIRTGVNRVSLSWANIGNVPVKVQVDYRTNSWNSWNFGGDAWELWSNQPTDVPSPMSDAFANAATGVTFSWNSSGYGNAGLTAINAVRVYAETSPGVWTVILQQTNPSAIYGRQITWEPPSTWPPAVATFEWAPAGTTNFTPLPIQESSGLYAVSMTSFPPNTYEYRVRYTRGNRLLAEQRGQLNVTASGIGFAVSSNNRYDVIEIPVSRVNAGLQWNLAPVPGGRVEVTYHPLQGTNPGPFGPYLLGSGPGYTFMFDQALAGQRYIDYDIMYYAPGQTDPYAKAGGRLNVVITDTPVAHTTSLISQYAVYPSGLQAIATPTGSSDGYLRWSTAPGPITKFYYWIGSGAPQELAVEPDGSGFKVSTASLSENVLFNYRIEYSTSAQGLPYARGTGSFQINRIGVITSMSVFADPPVTQTSALQSPTQSQSFDRWGNAISVTNAAGNTTNYRFNQFDQTIEVKMPEVDTTSTTAPSGGGSGSFSQQRERPTTRNYYDALGRLIGTRDANGNLNQVSLNSVGQVLSETHADGGIRSYGYNLFGNQTLVRDELEFHTWKSYDAAGRLTSTTRQVDKSTAANDITETYLYDEAGRRKSETNGDNETTRYFYDLNGNLSMRRSALGHETRYQYDAQGFKTSEIDAIGGTLAWSHDYWGRVLTSTNLSGKVLAYDYYNDGQIERLTTAQDDQDIAYAYDQAGHLIQINDTGWGMGRVTSYGYDSAGRVKREKVSVNGLIHQDTFTTYDEASRVKTLSDLRYSLTYRYDAQGNRTEIAATYFDHNRVAKTQDLWYAYDSMNRVVLSQGANTGGALNVNSSQGVRITYDLAGQRETVYTYGNRVYVSEQAEFWNAQDQSIDIRSRDYLEDGFYTEKYKYDGVGRLKKVDTTSKWRYIDLNQNETGGTSASDATLTEQTYDKASRQLTEDSYLSGDGVRTTITVYDDDGRADTQTTTWAGVTQSFISYDYDAANVLRSYTATTHNPSGTALYDTLYTNYFSREGTYLEVRRRAVSTAIAEGTTVPLEGNVYRNYNVNGELVSIVDQQSPLKNRFYVNGADGQPITAIQGDHGSSVPSAFANALKRADNEFRTQHFFFANGQTVGSFGQLQRGGKFVANFDVNYTPVSSEYPADAPATVIAQKGDTSRTIAARVFGDPNLWYLIAEANGKTNPDEGFDAGAAVTVPNEVVSLSNAAGTFKPFDVRDAIGDTTPTQPAPPVPQTQKKKGCGVLGQIIVVVVVIVVAYYTGIWLGEILGPSIFGTVASSVGGAVAGNIAGQLAGMAVGQQESFSWKSVAVAALTAPPGGVPLFGEGLMGAIAQGAVTNAYTQGVNIALGLQDSFSWRDVAVAAASAGVGYGVRSKVGPTLEAAAPDTRFAKDLVVGLAGGVAGGVTRLALGGKMDTAGILVDAFGNAIGNSIVSASSGTGELSPQERRERWMAGEGQETNGSSVVRDPMSVSEPVLADIPVLDVNPPAFDFEPDIFGGVNIFADAQFPSAIEDALNGFDQRLVGEINAAARAPQAGPQWQLDPAYVDQQAAALAAHNSTAATLGMSEKEYSDLQSRNEFLAPFREYNRQHPSVYEPMAAVGGWGPGLQMLGDQAMLTSAGALFAAWQPVGQALDLGELGVAGVHNLFADHPYELTGFSRLTQLTKNGGSTGEIWREGLSYSPLTAAPVGAFDLGYGIGTGDSLRAVQGGANLVLNLSAAGFGVGASSLSGIEARALASESASPSVLFGQRRVSPAFGSKRRPSYLAGRDISDVAADLRAGTLHSDQLPIEAFHYEGTLVSANTRSLAALSEAGLRPTKIRIISPTRQLRLRLQQSPLIPNAPLPGPRVPVTPSISDFTILRVITTPEH